MKITDVKHNFCTFEESLLFLKKEMDAVERRSFSSSALTPTASIPYQPQPTRLRSSD